MAHPGIGSTDSVASPGRGVGEETRRRVREYFAEHPRAMTMMAARELELSEADLLRCLAPETVWELRPPEEGWGPMLAGLEEMGKVHVLISNASTTLEAVGVFGGFSTTGTFLNVQSSTLDMHIRMDRLDAAFAVIKPSHFDGGETLSLQFYDRDGDSAFKVFLNFGGKGPAPEARERWQSFRKRYGVG